CSSWSRSAGSPVRSPDERCRRATSRRRRSPGGLGSVRHVRLAETYGLAGAAVAQDAGTGEADPAAPTLPPSWRAIVSSALATGPRGRTIHGAFTLVATSLADAESQREQPSRSAEMVRACWVPGA